MKALRVIAFIVALPLLLPALSLVAFAFSVRIKSSDSLAAVFRKLADLNPGDAP